MRLLLVTGSYPLRPLQRSSSAWARSFATAAERRLRPAGPALRSLDLLPYLSAPPANATTCPAAWMEVGALRFD